MGEAFLNGKRGGGGKLNNAIEEFKNVYQGQTVNAGDFVRFIEGFGEYSNEMPTSISPLLDTPDKRYDAYKTKVLQLDENRILVLHAIADYKLNALVVTLHNGNILHGEDFSISDVSYSGYKVEPILLPNGNVLLLIDLRDKLCG